MGDGFSFMSARHVVIFSLVFLFYLRYLYVCMCAHYFYQQTVQFTECNKRGIPWALSLGRIPYQTASSMCELPFAEDPLGDQ